MRLVQFISGVGLLIPFGIALLILRFFDPSFLYGRSQNYDAFYLVFAAEVAITSIPVISRIFLDLRILHTSFARVVLSSAVIEDVGLYVVISIAISLVGGENRALIGLPRFLGLEHTTARSLGYSILVPVIFCVLTVGPGRKSFQWLERRFSPLLRRSKPVAFLIAFMMIMTGVAIGLGISPMLGAFSAGIMASGTESAAEEKREIIRGFSFAFFIPIYFGIVGLKRDLIRQFDLNFFIIFMLFACGVKLVGVFTGARLAGEPMNRSILLATAMNARGGPGIVIASVALGAGIINECFYSSLVMLAIATSMIAGSLLSLAIRKRWDTIDS